MRSKKLWKEAPAACVGTDSDRNFRASPEPARSLALKVGDRVRHSKFGSGIVMNCNQTKDDQELTVVFEEFGVKKLLASLAPLEKIEKDLEPLS